MPIMQRNHQVRSLTRLICLWCLFLQTQPWPKFIKCHSPGHEIINELFNFRPTWLPAQQPAEMAVRYVDSSGISRVKGGRDLKQSQSYPKGCFPQLSPHYVKQFINEWYRIIGVKHQSFKGLFLGNQYDGFGVYPTWTQMICFGNLNYWNGMPKQAFNFCSWTLRWYLKLVARIWKWV